MQISRFRADVEITDHTQGFVPRFQLSQVALEATQPRQLVAVFL